MLAGFGLLDPQLRVLTAGPVDDEHDLARRFVDISDDLGDQRPHQSWQARTGVVWAFHATEKSSASLVNSRTGLLASCACMLSSRCPHDSIRSRAACRAFSNCAAIKRLPELGPLGYVRGGRKQPSRLRTR